MRLSKNQRAYRSRLLAAAKTLSATAKALRGCNFECVDYALSGEADAIRAHCYRLLDDAKRRQREPKP